MENLTLLHWLLAYATALIYVLLKVQAMSRDKNYRIGCYLKEHWASALATALMIPVCLCVLSSNFPDILPINNVTAALVGWQTNSMFRSLMSLGKKKYIKKDEPGDGENTAAK